MYQNILQQLQQLFSGAGNRFGMQPGAGGISDMMYRQPPGANPSFIDSLVGAGGGPAAGLNSIQPDGSTQFIRGERPGTYGISMNPPALGRPQPWGGAEPPGSPMYGVNPGGGMPRTGGGVTAFQPINSTPGFNTLPGNPGAFPGGAQTMPAPMPTPGMGGGERPGNYGVTRPGNPGMGGAHPMPMPTPGQGYKPPQMGRPMPMPRPPGASTPAPMGGMTRRVTGGY